MMKKLKRVLLAAALLSGVATTAHATEGWYGRIDVGYSFDGEVDDTFNTFDLDDDWMGSIGAGYAYQNGFRAELAYDYRNNDMPTLPGDGTSQALMLNGYYDFNRDGNIQPYVGLGVGYTQLEFTNNDDESGFAWQAQVGVALPVSDRLQLDVGYRYFNAPEVDYGAFEVDYEHQAVTVGLRWQFHAAAAPVVAQPEPQPMPQPQPQPQPVACPQSDFTVYFEWDRSNLNDAALQTIDAAVQRARQCNINAVVVVGHTDTSGSTQYNQGLSDRRAAVVRDALVARGLNAGTITTQARGETQLAQQTRDGVREPLNRRTAVTITFR